LQTVAKEEINESESFFSVGVSRDIVPWPRHTVAPIGQLGYIHLAPKKEAESAC
jgi:hypothetical protein